jgi:hypothetical protein
MSIIINRGIGVHWTVFWLGGWRGGSASEVNRTQGGGDIRYDWIGGKAFIISNEGSGMHSITTFLRPL